jgi:hypothetical protein
MEATWNTGRKYTAAGQIIRARVMPDGVRRHFAPSRRPDRQTSVEIDSEATLKAVVMHAHDHYKFRSWERSWMYLIHPAKEAV